MNINEGIGNFSWGEIVYNPRGTFGPLIQPCYQLVLVHDGSVRVDLDGQETVLEQGQVMFLVPGQRAFFQFSPERPTHHSWVHGYASPTQDGWSVFRNQEPRVVPITKRMNRLIRDLLESLNPSQAITRHLSDALVTATFHEFFRVAGFSVESPRPKHPSVERALAVMKRHYANPLDLDRIAREARLSAQHLSRLFREETGMTPVRMLWRIREDEGVRLLIETGLTVAEIAEACGFQNPYHFTRRIRDRFGIPPRRLRQHHWQSGSFESDHSGIG